MSKYTLEWINKEAEEGPLFKIGTKDIYYRERKGERVIRLAAKHSPNLDYLTPSVEAFHELSELWGAPIIFVIEPDVKMPPAAQFLYEWSRAAWQNGSVDQSFMLMHNPVLQLLGRFVCRMFAAGEMPFEAVNGRAEPDKRLDSMDTSPRPSLETARRYGAPQPGCGSSVEPGQARQAGCAHFSAV